MKHFKRKLLASIIAVMFSIMALGTSTYAWFSMNQEVSVTGMQISAKSDSTYLIIGGNTEGTAVTLADVQSANATSVAMSVANNVKVYPSAHDAVTNATDAATVGNWYYKTADVPSASASTSAPVALTSTNFSNYVIKKTVYVTLAVGSNAAANLKVSNFGLTQRTDEGLTGNALNSSAVKVLIASPTAVVELDSTNTTSNTVLAASVTDQALIALDIYIYYDGNNANVYTNNIANLAGATIALSFSVETVAQGN